jgi:outer membrane lipoprotein-sorting protein
MMKNAILLLILLFASRAQGQSATDIVIAADQLMQGTSSQGEMLMKIVRPKWTREIKIKSWSQRNEYSLMLITAPARDAGTGFLKREKELWNWQPTIDRVIKMPPSMMMQSWMGSDFTNDDLVRESSIVRDYTHELLGDTSMQGYDTWILELIPLEDAPVVWGAIKAYITKKDYYQLMVKYYDEDGYLINTMFMSEVKQMGNRMIPSRLEMVPAENPEQKTILIYLSMEFDVQMDAQFFSIQNMKNIRY